MEMEKRKKRKEKKDGRNEKNESHDFKNSAYWNRADERKIIWHLFFQ